jgi:RHS repeat-associated protein
VWLDDMPLAVVADVDTASPQLWFVHADHLDRPVKMTDGSKAVVWDAVYRPFGEAQSITGSATNNLRFPGQYFLIESGLHYNWHRHYDPTIGRYLQADPLAFVDGPSVYAYAGLAPTQYIDPDGNIAILPIVIGVGLGVAADYLIATAKEGCSCPKSGSTLGPFVSGAVGGLAGYFGPFATKSIGAMGTDLDTTSHSRLVGSAYRRRMITLSTRNLLRRTIGRRASYLAPGGATLLLAYELYDLASCIARK